MDLIASSEVTIAVLLTHAAHCLPQYLAFSTRGDVPVFHCQNCQLVGLQLRNIMSLMKSRVAAKTFMLVCEPERCRGSLIKMLMQIHPIYAAWPTAVSFFPRKSTTLASDSLGSSHD